MKTVFYWISCGYEIVCILTIIAWILNKNPDALLFAIIARIAAFEYAFLHYQQTKKRCDK